MSGRIVRAGESGSSIKSERAAKTLCLAFIHRASSVAEKRSPIRVNKVSLNSGFHSSLWRARALA